MMRTVYRNHKRFNDTYFSSFKGKYFTGDRCKRDDDGYYWITGRVDDVINVSGHRLGTAEVESALVLHKKVSEAAVVGYPHDIKGQGIYAYVTLMTGENYTNELKKRTCLLGKISYWSHCSSRYYSMVSKLTKNSIRKNNASYIKKSCMQ